MSPQDAITRAIKEFGSETKLADAIGFSQASVNRARRIGRPTAEMAVNIEIATAGRIKRAWLRPDIFGADVTLIENLWMQTTRRRAF